MNRPDIHIYIYIYIGFQAHVSEIIRGHANINYSYLGIDLLSLRVVTHDSLYVKTRTGRK